MSDRYEQSGYEEDRPRSSRRSNRREGSSRGSSRSGSRNGSRAPRVSAREQEQRRSQRRSARGSSRRGARSDAADTHAAKAQTPALAPASTPASRGRRVDALDGLRAICALGVVGYHMGMRWLSGGLLGVTVLFVLSGYLATDSIINEFRRNDGAFSVVGYYLRRIRRLMPQAVLTVVVTAALCTLFNHLLLTKMRPDVVPSLLMYLNWSKILSDVSYFAAAGAPSPLTHFWSLAIEWQFYLVWPLALLLIMRTGAPKRGVRIGLLVLAVASAVLMAVLYVPGEDPSRAYYGTDTRAMSLLLGCWLAFMAPMRSRSQVRLATGSREHLITEAMGVVSVAALVIMMVVTEGYTSFSYYGGIAAVSVVSVVAIAALLPEGTILSRILSLPPLVWLGQRSYALYLWHYPIVLLLTNQNSTSATPIWMYALQLGLSLVAAEITFRFVEKPCGAQGVITGAVRRFGDDLRDYGPVAALRQRALFLVPAVAVSLTAVIGLIAVPPVEATGGGEPEEERVQSASLRTPTTDGVYDVVLVGDSVPLDAYDQLAEVFPYGLIDCKISRQMITGIELIEGYVEDGVVGKDVVSCLGSNGVVTSEELDRLLAAVGDDRRLWLVNNRMKDDWQDANNQLFADFAAAHDNVQVIDWHGYSEGHDEYVWSDGEHPTPEGAVAYAACIKEAMNYEPATKENTTYAQLVVGDTVALDATDALASAFPRGAIDCAEGRGGKAAQQAIAGYIEQGVVGNTVVVAVGAEKALAEEDLESIVSSLGTERRLWLVNVRCQGQWQEANNELLNKVANAHDNVQLIDWYAASEGHDEYFSGDATNLSEKGASAYAQLISSAVGA